MATAGASGHSAAGSTSRGWIGPLRCRVPVIARPIPKSKRLSKKSPREGRESPRGAPGSGRGALWAQDEHRLGLKPVMRRAWALKGERPTVEVHHRYKWTYPYSFVRPITGEVHWLILPAVNTEVFSMAHSHFAEQAGAGKDKRILLVLDQAGWHTSPRVEIPRGSSLSSCPPTPPSRNLPRDCGR